MTTVFGILEFGEPLFCSSDTLGASTPVKISGVDGTLSLPALPDFLDGDPDPLHKPLTGPSPAQNWKQGEEPIHWGRPVSFPNPTAKVERALLELQVDEHSLQQRCNDTYRGFPAWLALFDQYVKLITKQRTHRSISGGDGPGRFELLAESDSGLRHISPTEPSAIYITISSSDESLHIEHFRECAQFASEGHQPRLHYRILLEAYCARRHEDYRKSIIEAGTALEVCLTMRIIEEFRLQNIAFGEKLLQKFRMLGGRFELLRILDIQLPDKDYQSLVINPRNDVIHRASFPDKKQANKVISEVETLLRLFSPDLHEN